MRGTLALALVALLVSACAANSPVVGLGLEYGDDWFEVSVENNTPMTLRVFALGGSGEILLGRVDAMSDRSLKIPAFASSTIQLVARPSVDIFPDRAHLSEPVVMSSGQRVTWQLQASPGISGVPRFSTVRVFACNADRGC